MYASVTLHQCAYMRETLGRRGIWRVFVQHCSRVWEVCVKQFSRVFVYSTIHQDVRKYVYVKLLYVCVTVLRWGVVSSGWEGMTEGHTVAYSEVSWLLALELTPGGTGGTHQTPG